MIGNDWDIILKEEHSKGYFRNLLDYLKTAYFNKQIYPEYHNIFNAFKLCSYENTKIIILGQDPYYNINQAHGLAFSVPNGQGLPKSLINIYKEIENDLGIKMSTNGNLEKWAKQGILLLNTVLTVEDKIPNSHKNIGWEIYTNVVIEKLCEKRDPLIFVLWGKNAQAKIPLIPNRHFILKATHPSPLSAYRGFFGCKHFSKINEILISQNKPIINWQV